MKTKSKLRKREGNMKVMLDAIAYTYANCTKTKGMQTNPELVSVAYNYYKLTDLLIICTL